MQCGARRVAVWGAGGRRPRGPPVVAARVFDLLAHLHVGALPPLEDRLRFGDELDGGGGVVAEDGAHVDLVGDLVGHLPRDARHEGLHPLVLLVVARDDPHHAQRVHHAGQRVDDLQQRAVQDVLEVALECGEELDVVLGLDVTLLKLAWRGGRGATVRGHGVVGGLQRGEGGCSAARAVAVRSRASWFDLGRARCRSRRSRRAAGSRPALAPRACAVRSAC